MKLNTELTAGPVVNIAVVLGINLVSAGSGVAFDAATGDFIKYNAESNVAHANLIASRILKTRYSGSAGCVGTFEQHSRSERKYFVKNLDKTVDSKALYDTFSTVGHILFCKMATAGSDQSKGFGFAQFENAESAKNAIDKLNGMLINDKRLHDLTSTPV